MAIDLSKVFKANVKAIRLSSGDDKTDILNEQLLKKNLDKNKRQKDNFSKEAKNIITNITILKKFLNENKRFYLQPNYLIKSNESFNDTDYQEFEDQAESIIKKCGDAIRNLKENTFKQIYAPQQKHHLENVFYLMEKYLKDVCKLYSEQKAIRVKRMVDRKKL
ncbi:unnamed protein product [Brachionus calyciflorus]|uniref:SNARE-complex protein Syntaxin-18 N-terminal domain-containing protein n=1 Tax=Brachionus calyciflorus TaxID=104777 RepID=A0A814A6A7_9BILA|nr:unnamed protein product [Brachionus calyciflorus]